MRKKTVYVGLLFIIVAIAVMYASSFATEGVMKGLKTSKNLTVSNNSFSVVMIPKFNTTKALTALLVLSDNSINSYVFNFTTFNEWKSFMQKNYSAGGLYYADMLKKGNSSLVYVNEKILDVMLPQNLTSHTSYLVIDNTKGSNSTAFSVPVMVTILPVPISAVLPYAVLEIIGVVAFLSGIVILIYGLIRKPKIAPNLEGAEGKKNDAEAAYIENLYKQIEKNKKGSRRKDNDGKSK